jgi:hypothetical protein
MGWFQHNSPVVQGMIDAFTSGEIVKRDLSVTGISYLGVSFMGKPLTASWYSGRLGGHRYLDFAGDQFFCTGREARAVTAAARARAARLFAERVAELDVEYGR